MGHQQNLAEWLAESPSRYVVLRRAEAAGEDDEIVNRPGYLRFNVFTTLPDGRRVASGVEINHCILDTEEVDVGSRVVEEARLAVMALLSNAERRGHG